jgi:uncharacterized membrane protein YkvA (DUF1232 family)
LTRTARRAPGRDALAIRLQREALAFYYVARDPRTPRAARWVALATVAYAFSPIDLIPDSIPVLGLLDDVLLVPFGFWLALRLTPPDVVADCRRRAAESTDRPSIGLMGRWVLLSWAVGLVLFVWLVLTFV